MANADERRTLRWATIAIGFVAVGSIAGLLGDPGGLRAIFVGVLIAAVVVGVLVLYALGRQDS